MQCKQATVCTMACYSCKNHSSAPLYSDSEQDIILSPRDVPFEPCTSLRRSSLSPASVFRTCHTCSTNMRLMHTTDEARASTMPVFSSCIIIAAFKTRGNPCRRQARRVRVRVVSGCAARGSRRVGSALASGRRRACSMRAVRGAQTRMVG